MSRGNFRDLRAFRDAVDGILEEIEGKKAQIEHLSEKIKGLNAILAREVHAYAEAEATVPVERLVDDEFVAQAKERMLRRAAERLAHHLLAEGLVEVDFRADDKGLYGSVQYTVRVHARLISPDKKG